MPTTTRKVPGRRKNQFVVRRGALPPSAQVLHFSPAMWEKFIEAVCHLRPLSGGAKYAFVKKLGGAGDGGRDIEARLVPALEEDRWDLYQAKHYDSGLTPSEVFPELAKFFKHLVAGTYPRPRSYYLCAPRGVGNDLHNLLANPVAFKERFLVDWKAGVTGFKGRSAELTEPLQLLIKAFDFGQIQECQLRDLLKWHESDSRAHHELFGIEPERGDDPATPALPSREEQGYVAELVLVYEEHHGSPLNLEEVMKADAYGEHFQSQRAVFYCAEGLKRFSRDLYSEDEFNRLLEMVLTGIRPCVHSPKLKTGMDRLEAGISHVSALPLTDSVLATRLRPGDLSGTCHHLVNQKKLKWVK
ncbi:ABC-three component system protein [Thiobacillus sp.]